MTWSLEVMENKSLSSFSSSRNLILPLLLWLFCLQLTCSLCNHSLFTQLINVFHQKLGSQTTLRQHFLLISFLYSYLSCGRNHLMEAAGLEVGLRIEGMRRCWPFILFSMFLMSDRYPLCCEIMWFIDLQRIHCLNKQLAKKKKRKRP